MKKHLKKIRTKMIALALICVLMLGVTVNVYAFPGNYYWFPSGMHVRIQHIDSGLYLGIDHNDMGQDGAQLKLQEKDDTNLDQIFYLKPVAKDSDGHVQYQIRVHGEYGKIVEVSNSSHDDYAAVQQWSEHDLNCGRWYFFTENNENGNKEAVCCIRNVESGKMINVQGNEGYAGNVLIQYHEDGTVAEAFRVICVDDQEASNGYTTTKTFKIDSPSSIDDCLNKIQTAERSAVGFGELVSVGTSDYKYFTGNIIQKAEVLSWQTFQQTVNVGAGAGDAYTKKTITVKVPKKIKYYLHKHDYSAQCTTQSVLNAILGACNQQICVTMSCGCGAAYTYEWDIPDFGDYDSFNEGISEYTISPAVNYTTSAN